MVSHVPAFNELLYNNNHTKFLLSLSLHLSFFIFLSSDFLFGFPFFCLCYNSAQTNSELEFIVFDDDYITV